jgi:DNA repair exonuclease SbcCD ATPase subunit
MVESMRNYRQLVEQKKGQLIQIERDIKSNLERIQHLLKHKENLESAQAIIQMIAQATQQELQYHINELVSLSLAAVFDETYTFEVDFVQRRNQTEADLWFVRDGERMHPLYATGGGPINVAAFALRVSLGFIRKNRSRPILILDEPAQNIKGDEANIRFIQMVKGLSERFGIQVIMVSDERVPLEDIEKGADKVFKVSMKKGVSIIKEI